MRTVKGSSMLTMLPTTTTTFNIYSVKGRLAKLAKLKFYFLDRDRREAILVVYPKNVLSLTLALMLMQVCCVGLAFHMVVPLVP